MAHKTLEQIAQLSPDTDNDLLARVALTAAAIRATTNELLLECADDYRALERKTGEFLRGIECRTHKLPQ